VPRGVSISMVLGLLKAKSPHCVFLQSLRMEALTEAALLLGNGGR
jgi:hypothetical protein